MRPVAPLKERFDTQVWRWADNSGCHTWQGATTTVRGQRYSAPIWR